MSEKDQKKEFEKKFIEGTCFNDLEDLYKDKTNVQINAPRALIAVNLKGAWDGWRKALNLAEEHFKGDIKYLNSVCDNQNVIIDKQKEEISSLRAGIEKITQSRDMFDQSAKAWQKQCKAHEKFIGQRLEEISKLKGRLEYAERALTRIAKEKSVLIDKNIDIENKLIVLKAELKEKEAESKED